MYDWTAGQAARLYRKQIRWWWVRDAIRHTWVMMLFALLVWAFARDWL